jgi:tRNA-2-methylthio-N6-dimethylallyladenosine synthase
VNVDRGYYLRAYGCQMNLYEADLVRGILDAQGYQEVTREDDAGVVLLITCSVRAHAEQRALGRLQNLRGLKRARPELVLAVLGCMAQHRAQELADKLGADLVVGPDDYRNLPELIAQYRREHRPQVAAQLSSECYDGLLPRAPSAVTGLVTVMRGCDNYCAYCIVPYVRGRERSKSATAILAEVRHLQESGVKDITLVGQNVLAFHDGPTDFLSLLQQVDAIAGSTRIRFLTSHPRDVTLELAQGLGRLPSLCPHIHLPLQSGSNRVLAAMNRRYTREQYLERVGFLRAAIPELALTTDVLVAFPGEDEADFEQTLALVEQTGFDFAYMFRYSERPGTRAAKLESRVPDEIGRRRLARLIQVQNRITRERTERLVGRTVEVLVEQQRGPDFLARMRTDKIVALRRPVPLGAVLNVKITGIQGWTPLAEPV